MLPRLGTSVSAYVADAGTSSKRPHGAFTWIVLGLGLALVIVAALSWVFYPWRHISPTIRSLAVLPLENLSGDASQDYFADGMTEELITDLGADQRAARDLPYIGDDIQKRSQALGRDCP